MKSSIIAVASLAALAVATPLDKRAYEYKVEWDVVTITVTGYPPQDTNPPATFYSAPAEPSVSIDTSDSEGRYGNWGGRGGWGGNSAPAAETAAPSAPAAAPVPESPKTGQAPASGSAPVNSPISSDYKQGILDSHNNHRANHSAPDLTWSDSLASIAQQIASSCVYAHDTQTGGGGYGQNIGAGAPGSDIPAMITNQMYNGEVNLYPGYGGEPNMGNFAQWGHFSQIVWKSTTQVGCFTQHCPGGLANTGGGVSPYFTVCNYSPPGNFGGQYGANVLAPKGAPTITL